MGRYGKTTTGAGYGGYSPPNYNSEHYSYADKGREEGNLEILINFKNIMNFVYLKILIWRK